ncbi:hypothetical protein [Polaromonas hydrogenivorans]|uniref:NodB homology domain-containing protein n=1 Tax=Polaromonas hydrogenivorans TaxID=335476 RepID=A0AAU7LM36_9BURK
MKLQHFYLYRALVTSGVKPPLVPNGLIREGPEKRLQRQFFYWGSRTLKLILAAIFFTIFWLAPAAAETPRSINMKLLVVSADGNEPVFSGIKSILNQIGVPYDTLVASKTPLTAQTLSDGLGAGRYQGVLLTTGNLAYEASPNNWQSAFTQAQWQMLWQYEADFRVRQATLYTYPAGAPDNYGLTPISAADTNYTPLKASLTTAGQQLFGYLNPASPVSITGAWTYLVKPISSSNPVSLLNTADGYSLASIYTYPDGRQNLAITTDGNPELTHTLLLGYGVVNWVSKGFFLGERKVYLNAQPDDIMIADDIWDPLRLSDQTGSEYRITGNDYNRLITWQNAVRASNTNAAQIELEMPYNGVGASGIYPNDTLTAAIRSKPSQFKWLSHTYEHELLTDISYANALAQLSKNHTVAQQLGFTKYQKDSMIQPEISGLNNPEFLRAAKDFGIRYILSDTSQPGWKNPSPNTGFYSLHQPSILIIPRYPTNLYYNVSTPTEWLSEYNYFYAPGGLFPTWDHKLTYSELLNKESEIWLRYLLKFDLNSVMFHQTNLRAYDNKNSLLGDLINATLAKYNSMYKLPIRSPSQHDTGLLMAARMAYNDSGVSGRIVLGITNSISLKTVKPVKAPLTGINYGTVKETYGGQTISTISLGANGTLTIPAPAW